MKKPPAENSQRSSVVSAYAVQCGKCFKWRWISSQDEYETIRDTFIEDPWYCNKNPDLSCNDPADMEYDTSRLWVIDKPNIPKTPIGLERKVVMRSDFSKMDVHYVMPNGKRVRSPSEVEKFLEANPQYKEQFSPANFNFTVPKILDEMVPSSSRKASSKRNKRAKSSKAEDNSLFSTSALVCTLGNKLTTKHPPFVFMRAKSSKAEDNSLFSTSALVCTLDDNPDG